MSDKVNIVKLTSAEISALWTTYMNDSVANCLLTHFIETNTDPEIDSVLTSIQKIANKHIDRISELFQKENIVIPEAFKVEKHVVPKAPKLFSDIFYIQSAYQMCRFGISSHSTFFASSAREDIRFMFKDFIDDASQLYNDTVDKMQQKGIFVRMPFMTYPTKIDFVKKENFLTGWLGRKRSLLSIEVTHLITNAYQNEIGRAICIGFSQVAQEQVLREYFSRGKQLSKHILSSIRDVLEECDIPFPNIWDQSVNGSTTAPFSDQLMLYIIGILSNLGMMTYGAGLSATMRRDISAMYGSFITKTGAYGEDGLTLMIEKGWMEQPPQFIDHEKIAKGK
ncbi:DUF3231 family protein [Bacillus sp. Gen3]|nr:DUF3231 family protein [Bacillus sp. Gen3]